jgi:hypothetical protein
VRFEFERNDDSNRGAAGVCKALDYWGNLLSAIELLRGFGEVTHDDGLVPHTTSQYLCCVAADDYPLAIKAIQSVNWHVNITFDKLVCNDDEHSGNLTTSVILRLSQQSQMDWRRMVMRFESAIAAAGVHLKRLRSQQEFFHSTMAVVVRSFPIDVALQSINAQIPVWTSEPLRIDTLLMLDPITWFLAS